MFTSCGIGYFSASLVATEFFVLSYYFLIIDVEELSGRAATNLVNTRDSLCAYVKRHSYQKLHSNSFDSADFDLR